jgi:hypothetical protein
VSQSRQSGPPRKPGAPSGSPLPLRPLTFGELLDAAVSLLRGHAAAYLTAGIVLAAAEQAVLYPLRLAAGIRPPLGLPYADRLGQYWVMLCAGLGTEATIIALLCGLTARAAGPALFGDRIATGALLAPRGSRPFAVVATALVVGVLTALCAFAGLVPWIFGYGLLGLAVPALVIDRVGVGRALWRSVTLAGRGGLRGVWIQFGGYLGWLAIRIALVLGSLAAISLIPHLDSLTLVGVAVAATVNGVAYATLACLDAVLHLETRMRVEGLDIALGRSVRHGRTTPAALVVRA